MTARRKNSPGAGILAAAALLVTGVYLVIRSLAAAGVVLAPPSGDGQVPAAKSESAAERAMARDQALEKIGAPPRDPFHPPTRVVDPSVRASAEREPEFTPEVRMILFDRVDPEAQISLGESISGRLRVGQTFAGWTIASITSSAVVVTKDGATHTLTLRRQP